MSGALLPAACWITGHAILIEAASAETAATLVERQPGPGPSPMVPGAMAAWLPEPQVRLRRLGPCHTGAGQIAHGFAGDALAPDGTGCGSGDDNVALYAAHPEVASPGGAPAMESGRWPDAPELHRARLLYWSCHSAWRQRVAPYADKAVREMARRGLVVSERRRTLLADSLAAVDILAPHAGPALYHAILLHGLPPGGAGVDRTGMIAEAHEVAWSCLPATRRRPVARLPMRLEFALSIPAEELRTMALASLLAGCEPAEAAAVCFALHPSLDGLIRSDAAGLGRTIRALGKRLRHAPISIDVDKLSPEQRVALSKIAPLIARLSGERRHHAARLLYACLSHRIPLPHPAQLEREFAGAVGLVDRKLARHRREPLAPRSIAIASTRDGAD